MLLEGKIAIVTGAGSDRGIGFATAKRFAEEGAIVALTDIHGDKVRETAAMLGDKHFGYQNDVRDAESCEAVVQQVVERFGRVDILVNNAGVSQTQRLMDSTKDDYDLVFDVSVRGTYNMSRAVVPHLRKQKSGAIVCIGSVAAQRGGGIIGGPHYSAAKGAVQSLAKAMARELAPDGIRVNAIAPGLTDTDLLIGKLEGEKRDIVIANTPLGRMAPPKEMANVCLFLVSDLASFVTGVVLDVNGGLHIH